MATLEIWVTEYWLWFGLATLLLALATIFGRFTFLIASVAALMVGSLSYLFPYAVGLEIQGFYFLALSSVMIWLTRSWQNVRQAKIDKMQPNIQSQSYVGREFALASPIINGGSSIRIDDVVWGLRGDDAPAGTTMRVVMMGEGLLQVEKVSP